MTTIGPLSGADARAYRHPPTAARAVPRAARKRMKVKRRGRDTDMPDDGLRLAAMAHGDHLEAMSHHHHFFSCSMTAFACAASCDVGSAVMTFSSALIVASLSPLFNCTSASLNSGLPHVPSRSDAFW